MAALSALRGFGSGQNMLKRVMGSYLRTVLVKPQQLTVVSKETVRFMGHKRTIQIIPTRYEWTKFKDHMNFYILLGIIPIGIIIGATNIFIGPAELIDIPEDYEPKYWEYYRHPISRFIARNFLNSEEKLYERHLHFMANEMERIEMRKLEEKVKLLISTRHDYKRWYYIPKLEDPVHITREFEEYNEENSGQRGV